MSKGEESRERILDAAYRMAGRDGFAGLSLRALAAELGVSKSGLFAHFGCKQDLQLEILGTTAKRFTETVLLPAFRMPRGLPRVRQVFENWLHWAVDPAMPGGCPFVAASIELDDRDGPVRALLVDLQQGFLDALARSARIAVEEGHFRRDLDCDQFAFELHSILLGFNHARRLLREPAAGRRARGAFARLLHSAQPVS